MEDKSAPAQKGSLRELEKMFFLLLPLEGRIIASSDAGDIREEIVEGRLQTQSLAEYEEMMGSIL